MRVGDGRVLAPNVGVLRLDRVGIFVKDKELEEGEKLVACPRHVVGQGQEIVL